MTEARMPHVLVVEDEAPIAELIALHLRHSGFVPECVPDANAAWERLQTAPLPQAAILDWMLPAGPTGLELAQRLRDAPRTRALPVLMLTARGEEGDKLAALGAGADDYITKPFSPRELIARLRAVLRRTAPELAGQTQDFLDLGPLRLDLASRAASFEGASLRLSPSEFRLLALFMRHPQRVFSREQLLRRAWEADADVDPRTVDVHIKRLRQAMGPVAATMLTTVRGVGYQMLDKPLDKPQEKPENKAQENPS